MKLNEDNFDACVVCACFGALVIDLAIWLCLIQY
jgi:hypothetical protein